MRLTFNVDLVFCVDTSGSMSQHLPNVKKMLLKFYESYIISCESKGKNVHELRVKLIRFSDIYYDGPDGLIESCFFSLPEEKQEFINLLNETKAKGGGESPENGLEALDIAIQSDWNDSGDRKRSIIVLWTDNKAHELEQSLDYKPNHYPQKISSTFEELTDKWELDKFIDDASKRLILFSPDCYPWDIISNTWSNTISYISDAGQGLDDMDHETIISCLVNSI